MHRTQLEQFIDMLKHAHINYSVEKVCVETENMPLTFVIIDKSFEAEFDYDDNLVIIKPKENK